MTIKKITTSLTIRFFLVVSITGILLFIELAPGSIRATHEWMSLLFVLTGLLYVYESWRIYEKERKLLLESCGCFTRKINIAPMQKQNEVSRVLVIVEKN